MRQRLYRAIQKQAGVTNAEAWLTNRLIEWGVSKFRAVIVVTSLRDYPAYKGRVFMLGASPDRPDAVDLLKLVEIDKQNVFPAGSGDFADTLGCFVPTYRARVPDGGVVVCGFVLGEGGSEMFTWDLLPAGVEV